MRAKRLFCIVLSLILCLTLCTPALAEGDLLFVAVNDSIPLTLTALPYESSSGIYVPYTAFDASPGGVIPAYNAQAQTFVLFTRQRRLVFDLAEGTVTDQDGNVKTVSTTFRGGMLYVPLVYCASFFSLKVSLLQSTSGYPILRFTTGSEVYDDSLFVEKAESLIQYRIDQMNTPEPSQPQTPAQQEPDKPEQPEPEQMPATVYLAFTNAETMADNAALLEKSNLRGTFFLTAAELTADPALARRALCRRAHSRCDGYRRLRECLGFSSRGERRALPRFEHENALCPAPGVAAGWHHRFFCPHEPAGAGFRRVCRSADECATAFDCLAGRRADALHARRRGREHRAAARNDKAFVKTDTKCARLPAGALAFQVTRISI